MKFYTAAVYMQYSVTNALPQRSVFAVTLGSRGIKVGSGL